MPDCFADTQEKTIMMIDSCGGFNTPTLCVVTKGIKADCNHLIEHTVRNVEHCAPTLASGLLIISAYSWVDASHIFKRLKGR